MPVSVPKTRHSTTPTQDSMTDSRYSGEPVAAHFEEGALTADYMQLFGVSINVAKVPSGEKAGNGRFSIIRPRQKHSPWI